MYFCQMKQTIILSIGLLFLASCNKVPKCWDCTRTVTLANTNKKTVDNNKVCDMTKEQMQQFTKVNTTITTTVSVVTECH